MPPNSLEKACREALIDYLQNQTAIDWNYFESRHTPDMEPKGGVKFYSLIPERSDRFELTAQLRLLLSGNAEGEVQGALLDWGHWIEKEMRSLSRTGITGNYSGIALHKALQGIKLSDRGIVYQSESNPDNAGETLAIGTLFAEYEFKIEAEAIVAQSF